MFLSTYNLVLILGLLSLRAAATALEAPWVVPDGNSTDFTQTFTNGAPLAIAWEGWDTNTRLFVLGDITKANLWVTSFDFKEVQYSQLLAGMFETAPFLVLFGSNLGDEQRKSISLGLGHIAGLSILMRKASLQRRNSSCDSQNREITTITLSLGHLISLPRDSSSYQGLPPLPLAVLLPLQAQPQ